MGLKKNIQTILREESKILGLRKNVVSESKEKSLPSLEKSIEHFLSMSIEEYDLPENFHKMVVDVYYNRWGSLECNVSILFKNSFSLVDSYKMNKIVGNIRNEIREYFGDIFSNISSGGSTIDAYNTFKWWYDERKNRRVNESEEKQPKYLNIIKDIIEPFKEEDCVCDITISFEYESYNVYLVFSQEELNGKFFSSNQRFHYIQNLRKNVKNTIKDFLPIDNFYVGSMSKPNCEWNPMNESEEKKLPLLNKIKNVGLYKFMEDSGITYVQLKQKVGDIPRDVKLQFIKDYVISHSNPDEIYKGIDFYTDHAIPIRSTKDLVHLIEQIVILPRTNRLEFDIWVYEVDNGSLGNSDRGDSYTLTEEKATDDDLDAIINHFFKFS